VAEAPPGAFATARAGAGAATRAGATGPPVSIGAAGLLQSRDIEASPTDPSRAVEFRCAGRTFPLPGGAAAV